jgi:hypothetical protein
LPARRLSSPAQRVRHPPEPFQRPLQILHDLRRNFLRRRQQVGIIKGIVLEPEDIEVDLVAGDEVRIGEAPEPLALPALGARAAGIAPPKPAEAPPKPRAREAATAAKKW